MITYQETWPVLQTVTSSSKFYRVLFVSPALDDIIIHLSLSLSLCQWSTTPIILNYRYILTFFVNFSARLGVSSSEKPFHSVKLCLFPGRLSNEVEFTDTCAHSSNLNELIYHIITNLKIRCIIIVFQLNGNSFIYNTHTFPSQSRVSSFLRKTFTVSFNRPLSPPKRNAKNERLIQSLILSDEE